MKKGETYFKYSVMLMIAVIIFLIFRKCGSCVGTRPPKNDTTIVRDTQWIQIKTDTQYIPQPYKVVKYKFDTLFLDKEQPSFNYDSLPKHVQAIISEYYTKKFYSDSFDVKYGKLYLSDTLWYNRIIGKGFKLDQSIPEITETITIVKHEKKKNIGYFGIGAFGNLNTPLYGTTADFSIKWKNDKIYSVGGILTKGGDLYGKFEIKIPIRFKK